MKRSNEPVFWSLFGAGGMVAALLLPVMILLTLMGPLGMLPEGAMSYERMLAFSQSILGKLVILAAIILPLWHAAHRLLHGLHDLGIHVEHAKGQKIFYGAATILSVVTVLLVLLVGW